MGDDPINTKDPDGADVIYVNGYRPLGSGDATTRDSKYQKQLKDTYWNKTYKGFTKNVDGYFNDYVEHFVNASHSYGSDAATRIKEGKTVGIAMVKDGEIKISKTNHIMTIVMHSQGNAEGVGIAEGILAEAKKEGLENVTVNLVFLSVHQPYDIPMTPDLQKRGIQFTYANDDNYFVQPMAKQKGGEKGLKGVADANAKNKKNKDEHGKDDGGVDAHGATHDKPEALDDIKTTDQKQHIYIIKQ